MGIEEESYDLEEPKFNHLYLRINCNLPQENPFGDAVFKLFPTDFMHYFYRSTGIYVHGLCINDDQVKEGRIDLIYHIGFEKRKPNPGKMRAVLREAIAYIATYMTTNIEMLERTKDLSK